MLFRQHEDPESVEEKSFEIIHFLPLPYNLCHLQFPKVNVGWAHGSVNLRSTHPPRNCGKSLICTVSYMEHSLPITC